MKGASFRVCGFSRQEREETCVLLQSIMTQVTEIGGMPGGWVSGSCYSQGCGSCFESKVRAIIIRFFRGELLLSLAGYSCTWPYELMPFGMNGAGKA